MGEDIPWAELTKAVLCIYFVLTILAMTTKPDFLSLGVVMLGFFSMECSSYVTRRTFRLLVGLSFVSFVYDIVFLLFIRNVQAEDMEFQGMQINVHRFAYLFVWLSFCFRPIVILILWKDSRDFRKIIRGKGGSESNIPGQSNVMDAQELELARIMASYGN
jgi:hypothetical protein